MTVFSPLTSLIPWANCPNLFAKDLSQVFLSGTLIECLYSWGTPEIWWVTELFLRFLWNCAVNTYRGRGFFIVFLSQIGTWPSLVHPWRLRSVHPWWWDMEFRVNNVWPWWRNVDLVLIIWRFLPLFIFSDIDMYWGNIFSLSWLHFWGKMAAVCSDCCYGGSAALFTFLAVLVNILESCSIATNWESPMLENGAWCAGFSRHSLIHAPRWWHFLRTICRGVDYYEGKTQHNPSLILLLFWWQRRYGIHNGSSRDIDTNPLLHGMPTCLSPLAFCRWLLVYQAGLEAWRRSWICHAVVHTLKFLGSCVIVGVSWAWEWQVG